VYESLASLARGFPAPETPTPFLAIDLDAMDRNIERMAAHFRDRKADLRPHVKHHKSCEIAELQIAAGCNGLTCSTTDEVRALTARGVQDLLLANVLTDPARLAALSAAARAATVTLAVDSKATASMASEAATRAGAVLGVVIEVDIGMRRNGVSDTPEAIALAEFIDLLPGLQFRGVMAYEGNLVGLLDRAERAVRVLQAFEPIAELVEVLRRKGMNVAMVTGGAASTYDVTGDLDMITDVQAGSYVLMDAVYTELVPEFEPAVAMICSVLTSRPGRPVVVDAGAKRLATDWGTPVLAGWESTHYATSEEHNRFVTTSDNMPDVGERVAVIPAHTCTTMSMHSKARGFRGGHFDHVVAIDCRDPLA